MAPSEREPHSHNSQEPDRTIPESSPQQWAPTQASFEKLLAAFSSDSEEAIKQYEIARRKLIKIFERRQVIAAEREADKSFDRAMRRLDEGEVITNIMAYLLTIARNIFLEHLREEKKYREALTMMTRERDEPKFDDEPNPRQDCFDRCLEELPFESRALILEYFEDQGGAKIKHHTSMAAELGITTNALRIKVHRIRIILEACVKKCVAESLVEAK
jgi:DNA-directed RNA polymerase specialized sigma24 family protein